MLIKCLLFLLLCATSMGVVGSPSTNSGCGFMYFQKLMRLTVFGIPLYLVLSFSPYLSQASRWDPAVTSGYSMTVVAMFPKTDWESSCSCLGRGLPGWLVPLLQLAEAAWKAAISADGSELYGLSILV